MSGSIATTTQILQVPGARLYYEVRGAGPVLMLIGAPMDSGGFAALAPLLATDHTVVTYDPRGITRSFRDDRTQDVTPETHADDLYRLWSAVGAQPAYVLGSSGGAISAIALATRHPECVRTLVAHEPPLLELLPDRDRLRAEVDDIVATYRAEGEAAALRRFFVLSGLDPDTAPAGAEAPGMPAEARENENEKCFFEHMMKPFTRYRPDLDMLRTSSTRVVVAGGVDSAGQLAHRTAVALAERLGTELTTFPGDHGGFLGEPEAFARTLRHVLGG